MSLPLYQLPSTSNPFGVTSGRRWEGGGRISFEASYVRGDFGQGKYIQGEMCLDEMESAGRSSLSPALGAF